MSPAATPPARPRRFRLTVALLSIAMACAVVLGVVLPQEAQPCALYGSITLPRDPLRFMLPALYSTPESIDAARHCLRGTNRSRELVVTLIDTVFALSYGGGLVLLLRTLARRAVAASAVSLLLRCGAICFAAAAAVDLIENQITAVLLTPSDRATSNLLIASARVCAVPKYVLALAVGPALALLAGVLAIIARLSRGRPNGNGRA